MSEKDFKSSKRATLLLVDDDPLIRKGFSLLLSQDFTVITAEKLIEVQNTCQDSTQHFSLALVDLGLPPSPHTPEEGFKVIQELLRHYSNIKILVLSGQNQLSNIQQALALGAVDFLEKPVDTQQLTHALKQQAALWQYEKEQRDNNKTPHSLLIGKSAAINAVHTQIQQLAASPFPVLIEGESGTGKELIAQAIHKAYAPTEPFIAINCAALNAELIESELFGHTKGAFTGASQVTEGFIKQAGKGILFLDEIGELPLLLQAKLLRLLENGEYYKIGDPCVRQSQARIIAATNKDLKKSIQESSFRADLYHRLSTLLIRVPPLRERKQDILLLVEYFQNFYQHSLKRFKLDNDAQQLLFNYTFKGNIRELKNLVIRLGTKYPTNLVSATQLIHELEPEQTQTIQQEMTYKTASVQDSSTLSDNQLLHLIETGEFKLDDFLQDIEARCIRIALSLNDNKIAAAARNLNINRSTLHSRIQNKLQK